MSGPAPFSRRRLLAGAGALLATPLAHALGSADPVLDGRALMARVRSAHPQYPWIYEEQSMVLVGPGGDRETRQLTRYSRVEADGSANLMLLLRSPREVRGVAVLARMAVDGTVAAQIYLPALGAALIDAGQVSTESFDRGGALLGTDFALGDFLGERLDDHRFERRRDRSLAGVDCAVVDVLERHGAGAGRRQRRHWIALDRELVVRTDHFDTLGRARKRQSWHDFVSIAGSAVQPNMTLMIDLATRNRTLVRVDRRVFSEDYVPAEVFTAAWLHANQPPMEPEPEPEPRPDGDGEATGGAGNDPATGGAAGDDRDGGDRRAAAPARHGANPAAVERAT